MTNSARQTSSSPTFGFIGLGHQGTPMAERMIAGGLRPHLWARRQEVLDRYAEAEAEIAASPAELASRCDVIGLCLYDGAATDAVVFGDDGLLDSLRAGATLAVHATVGPAYATQLAAKVADRDIAVVDAPVSGGDVAAAAGELLVLAAGESGAIDRCEPMFATYAKQVVRLGDLGAAQSAKLINNGMMAAISGLVLDAFDLGTALGIDSDGLGEVLANGSAANPSVGIHRMLGAEQFAIRAWPTLHKDVDLVGALADEVGEANSSLMTAARAAIADMAVRRADYVRERESSSTE